ncbi:hypothetical protein CAPTEDRAFT_151321 [Capitella teleta]|uniref:BTB domain-containing protein n=1 Tax=Capitella teleta TaxID=283909 RepID=R7TGL2_CAPTE|nr:hypothetical protein CAPTEDRAFT_151321 [Capitella teleta]|eukprot:ELT90250.1 hypothetical protein CAPTEDRAFT_151321 [Capitella teleta]
MIPVATRSLSFSNHAPRAFQVMHELLQRKELCDVTLQVGSREFRAHRIVLAGCCPYLRAMFTNGMLETGQNVVTLQDLDEELMETLLEYMYTGCVTISTTNVQSLLQGASLLHLTDLHRACCQFLQLHIDAANCLGIHAFADVYSCTELESVSRRYINQHFSEVIHHEEFLNLPECRLVELLSSDHLQVSSEEQMFEAALMWVNWVPSERQALMCGLMKQVRLPLLSDEFLENVVLQTEIVHGCPKCQSLVASAMHTKADPTSLSLISPRSQPQGIYVIGGRNSSDCQLKSMEKYDFLRDEWVTMGNMQIARTAVGAATLNGLVMAVGGECALAEPQDETMYLRCVEAYNPRLKEWLPLADMKVARSFASVCVSGDYLYALGGEDRTSTFNVVEKYDYKANSWSFVSSMQRKRAGSGVAVCDGRIYMAGGYDKSFHTDRASVECYDPDTKEWTFVAEMEKARSGLTLVTLGHCIYALGGRSRHNDMYYESVERYNTWTKQWSSVAPMNSPRAWPSVAVVDNRIYVIGGFDGSNRLRSVETYDPEHDSWTFIASLNMCRAGSGATVL